MVESVDTQELYSSPERLEREAAGLSFGILLISYPDERQEIVELTRATVHVGRAPDNDVILDDDLIADHHAQILCDGSGCQVLDLGSHIGSQILERADGDRKSLTGLRLPPKMPYPLIKGTTVLMGEILLIYYPSRKELPVTAPKRGSRLVLFFKIVGIGLLVCLALASSAVSLRKWFPSKTPVVNSAASASVTSAPTVMAQATVAPTAGSNIYVVETDFRQNLHIRTAPGLDKEILGKIPYGTVVRVWSEPVAEGPYHWVRVDAPNLSGWCIFEALRPQ